MNAHLNVNGQSKAWKSKTGACSQVRSLMGHGCPRPGGLVKTGDTTYSCSIKRQEISEPSTNFGMDLECFLLGLFIGQIVAWCRLLPVAGQKFLLHPRSPEEI